MKIKIFFLFLAVFLSACDPEQGNKTKTVIYNTDVVKALSQYQSAYKLQRTAIVFANGTRANNCEAYIKASKSTKISEGINNQSIKSEYLVCDVLLLIGETKFSVSKNNSHLGSLLAKKIDLRSFPSSHFQMLDEKTHTLAELAGDLMIDGATASVESNDWHYALELVAAADINKNGKADWIIWLIDEAKTGDYRAYQTLIVYDVDNTQDLFKAKPFPN